MSKIPDWQLPPGVDRGLWDYTHSDALAREYDASLAETPLLELDVQFCERHFPIPGRLLDLGCGTGRLMIPFARRAFQCVGVDLSSEMLAVAREKAKSANVDVTLVEANLVELDALESESFDYAACLFSTFGMIRGRDHRLKALQHVKRLLRPSARFVVHVHHRWFIGWSGVRKQVRRDLGRTLLRRSDAGDRTAPVTRAGAELTLHHFTRSEILRDLNEVGFRIVEMQRVGVDRFLKSGWPWQIYGFLIACERV